MSSGTRNTIIGVCVGVGGAIILAGLFAVAWRVWGKKRRGEAAEADGLMMDNGRGFGHEKSSSVSGANPFQSTLESYHNPANNVNTASNF